MSEVKPQGIKPNQVMVVGRIEATRRYEGSHFSRVMTPAIDSYSRPQMLMIRSTASLGRKGDEIKALCQLGGFTRKPFEVTDKSTGEVEKVIPVDMTLELIEE